MTVPVPPPPELRRHGLERIETNLPADRAIAVPSKTLVLLFGDQLLAALSQVRQRETPP